jgi:hypothetical protein
MWAQILNVGLGLWLMAAPAVLQYAGRAAMNDYIVGPVVASIAAVAVWEITRQLRWINLVLGLWLLIAPWVFGYEWITLAHGTLVGLLLMTFSLVSGQRRHRFGGGWASLWKRTAASPEP